MRYFEGDIHTQRIRGPQCDGDSIAERYVNVVTVERADQWLDRFFDYYYSVNPVSATFIGVHSHDYELPPLASASDWEAIDAEAATLLDDLARVRASDGIAERIDILLAQAHLRAVRIESESQHIRRNPCFYTGEAIFGVVSLFLRDYAPMDQRLRAAVERLSRIPAFLAAGFPAIESAPRAWVTRAIKECDGADRLLREGLPLLFERPGVALAGPQSAIDDAIAAFADFRRRLVERDGSEDTATYAIGESRFDQLLRESHLLDMTGDEIAAYARQELAAAKEALKRDLAAMGYTDWAAASDALASEHPKLDGYLNRFEEVWDAAREHAIERELLTWPDFPITFEPIPDWARSAAPHLYFLYYRCPPAVDDGQAQRYRVPSLGDDPERGLRSVNEAQIALNHVIHHAGIGHHVQNWHAARAGSRIGRMAGNDCALRIAMHSAGTLVEGWACYATDLMAETGFLSPLQRLSMRHSRMRTAARAIVDVELHAGRFSLDDAIGFYVAETGMSPEAAWSEAVKNSIFPTMAMMYLIGTDLIHDLRDDMRERWGAEFSLRRFHDEFLSWGAVPVTLIARAMRGEPLEAGGFSERASRATSQD